VKPSITANYRGSPASSRALTSSSCRQACQDPLERVRDGLVTVLDVRPPEEFAQGHVAGALNVPLERLQDRLKELPTDREVVAYCRGPWCVLSFEAVARLRAAGFAARRLQDGLPEWRRAGLPVVTN